MITNNTAKLVVAAEIIEDIDALSMKGAILRGLARQEGDTLLAVLGAEVMDLGMLAKGSIMRAIAAEDEDPGHP